VRSIVIAPAKTGKANKSKKVVIIILQENNEHISIKIDFCRIIITEERKFKDLIIEEIPAKCKDKIVKSIDAP
jgi:hypothetical protein